MKPPANDPGEQTSKETITVELGPKTTVKVKPFKYTNVEGLLKMKKHHEYILSQQEVKTKWDANRSLLADAKTKILLIDPDTNKSTLIKGLARLNETSDTLTKRAKSLVSKAFTLYQQTLGATLRKEWDKMVQDHWFTTGYLDSNGVAATLERGQDWTTLAECKSLHLLTVCNQYAAETHQTYVNATLKNIKNLHQTLLQSSQRDRRFGHSASMPRG